MNNFTFSNERYQYYETIAGGAGAGPGFAGASGVQTHMTNSRLTDPEVLENRYPVLVREFAIREGSGGAGRYRGGDGVVRRIEFREAMTAAVLSNHRRIAPFGLAGGAAGQTGRNSIRRASGASETLSATVELAVEPGDEIQIETPVAAVSGRTISPPINAAAAARASSAVPRVPVPACAVARCRPALASGSMGRRWLAHRHGGFLRQSVRRTRAHACCRGHAIMKERNSPSRKVAAISGNARCPRPGRPRCATAHRR
jgi:hypothetical protein